MKLEVLSYNDIERKESVKKDHKKEVLVRILNLLSKRIEIAYSLGRKEIYLEIPEMIFGYPAYRLSFVTLYMNKQLQNLGYKTSILGRGLLHVSWRKIDTSVKVIEVKKNIKISNQPDLELETLSNLKKTANNLRKKYTSK
jgi:hypothetical protein